MEFYDYFRTDPYPITLKNFPDFIDGSFDRVAVGGNRCLTLQPKKGASERGIISVKEIDVLLQYPYIHTVCISGLCQDTFEFFIRKYGPQLRAIRFLHNPMVEDWSLLGTLQGLEFVYWMSNDHISSLWDMRQNKALQGLAIQSFSRLDSLAGIEKAPSLKYLHIGDAAYPDMRMKSLTCLASTGIRHLTFMGKEIEDGDASFVFAMPRLERFDFHTNLFTTEQVAWIMANCPDLKGKSLRALIKTTKCIYGTDVPAVQLVGMQKPLLLCQGHERRIEKFQEDFDALIEAYRGVSYGESFGIMTDLKASYAL